MSEIAVQDPKATLVTGRKPNPVVLHEDDERLLQGIAASTCWEPCQVRNAKVVLAMAKGERVKNVAWELGFSVAGVRRVCRRFQREGVSGLLTVRQRTGRPRRVFVGD
ncbi:hypothetical protein AYO44_06685 [Planctomycetaceae bacterium SCGC AG-212-F19]|nr:hypothetical protein AYO44_06685 [Planctomycetaceae bacterium SCGC AG-212-F19]